MIVPRPLGSGPIEALQTAASHAPYLKRLLEWAERNNQSELWLNKTSGKSNIGTLYRIPERGAVPSSIDAEMQILRLEKANVHLAIAASDLSGELTQSEVTQALNDFADAAVQSALMVALASRGLKPDGIFIIALGKMGAGELNYSSDIDIVAMYDPDVFDAGDKDPAQTAMNVVKDLVRILNERTGDGYVFRTDLRLRPDPSSTPLCVSTRMAETYYESVGQNWERMAWIKARACAGDVVAAERFMKKMEPFVWRRHLDYWAIGDIHAIKHMVNAKVGDPSLSNPSADVKLGPGGIREIEFFAQTQQLILGGRNPALRSIRTIDALRALEGEGVIKAETAEFLRTAYETLRAVEHRIQMLNDQQTHTLPADNELRANVAALMGYSDLAEFDVGLLKLRQSVHEIYSDLFADEERLAAEAKSGNLVFTGVDDDPGTVRTLADMGFSDPSYVINAVQHWHRGHTPATRTSRGRGLLTALLPKLLRQMSNTGEADTAFRRFQTFFEHLPSGVQTLSMLLAEPDLLDDLVVTLALAPRLAVTLGRKPALLEALIEGGVPAELSIPADASFEEAMNAARRYHRDSAFLIGHRLLHAHMDAKSAGQAYSDLADEILGAMADVAEKETARRFGAKPGTFIVAAFGKLGGRELSATSDLDLVVIYDAPGADAAQTWYTRFTQRLITALSVPTAEGELYEVDMRLRPSGNSGPVAASLSGFQRYYKEDAWTWEHMALTRLRVVAGDLDLGALVESIASDALSRPRDAGKTKSDIYDMRRRLASEKASSDLWELKTAPGGLIDIEFVVQQSLLLRGMGTLKPTTANALESLAQSNDLPAEEIAVLQSTLRDLLSLQQVLRLAVGERFNPDSASEGLKNRIARVLGSGSFSEASSRLGEGKELVAGIRCKKIGPITTDEGELLR